MLASPLKPWPLIALLLAAPAAAQDEPSDDGAAEAPTAAPATPQTTQPEAAQPEATTAAPAESEGGLGLSLSDDAAPEVGQIYARESFTDWELRCERTEGGDDPCQLYQLLQDQDGNSVAEISVFDLPDGGPATAGATIVTPLETLLTEQITMSVDGGTPRRYPFSFCTGIGCIARVGFTAEEVASFRRGNAATLSIVPALAPDQRVDLSVSLAGFTAGFDALEPVADPAQ